MKRIGFIDYYLDEWHANNYPAWIRQRSGGEFEVTSAWGEIPSPRPNGRTNEQWSKDMGIPLCGSIEELIEQSDVLVVLSPDNPEQHLRLSRLACESGKRLYIDKTFAPDAETARAIFAVADAHNTPCWSSSALRFADAYAGLRGKGITGESVRRIHSFGGGELRMYCIHQIEPIVSLMGCGSRRVMSLGAAEFPSVLIEFDGGRTAVFNMHPGAGFAMNVEASDSYHALNIGGNFWDAFIDNLIDFFRTGKIIVPHEETVEIAAIRDAAIRSLATPYEWVEIIK